MQDEYKTAIEHLSDLRRVIIRSLIAVAVSTIISFAFSSKLFFLLMNPYLRVLKSAGTAGRLQSLTPPDTFLVNIKLAFICGIILSLPFLVRELWAFFSPALRPVEKRFIIPAFFVGLVFFLIGSAFAFFIMIPTTLNFLRSYSLTLNVAPIWTISGYFSFVLTILIAFGIAFELPLIILLIVRLGLVSARTLASARKYIIVGIAIASAILTPPDVISMLFIMIPLLLLFEISLLASRLAEKVRWNSGEATLDPEN